MSHLLFLHVPFARTSIMQSRAFSVFGPLVWNGIPLALRSLPRVFSQKFLQQLKTALFDLTAQHNSMKFDLMGVMLGVVAHW